MPFNLFLNFFGTRFLFAHEKRVCLRACSPFRFYSVLVPYSTTCLFYFGRYMLALTADRLLAMVYDELTEPRSFKGAGQADTVRREWNYFSVNLTNLRRLS